MIPSRKIVITGAGGRLGAALAREYGSRADVVALDRNSLDLGEPERVRARLAPETFDVLINCAAQTNVDRCETHREEAFAINAEAAEVLAQICSGKRARLIHISTDYVFDGEKPEPLTEEDEERPISVYGESKLEGERRVLGDSGEHVVARVSWVFGPDRPSFVDAIVQRAREDDHVAAIADKFSTPTYTRDIADLLEPFLDRSTTGGVFHITQRGHCSWREYAQWALDCCRAEGIPLRAHEVQALSLKDMANFIARRPVHTALATAKYERVIGRTPRDWHDAVAEYVRDHLKPRASV